MLWVIGGYVFNKLVEERKPPPQQGDLTQNLSGPGIWECLLVWPLFQSPCRVRGWRRAVLGILGVNIDD